MIQKKMSSDNSSYSVVDDDLFVVLKQIRAENETRESAKKME